MKKLWQKIKDWFKSLWSASKPVVDVVATPVGKPPVASPVAAPTQPETVVVGGTPISRVTDNFLRSGAGYGQKPVEGNSSSGASVDRSGFNLGWSNGNWKANQLGAGYHDFLVTVPDQYYGAYEVTWTEGTGTVQNSMVTAYVMDSQGNIIADTSSSWAVHGKVFVRNAVPGLNIVKLHVSIATPLVVQLNH